MCFFASIKGAVIDYGKSLWTIPGYYINLNMYDYLKYNLYPFVIINFLILIIMLATMRIFKHPKYVMIGGQSDYH